MLRTDEAGAQDVLAADPYFTTSGVEVASVRQWQPVVGPAPDS